VSDAIAQDLVERMRAGSFEPLPDAAFEALARRVFAAQFAACEPYRAYCGRRGVTPGTVRHWSEIPAVPVRAFQEGSLSSDDAPVVRVFETSGTTTGRRGRHALSERALALYRRSLEPSFRHFLLPELEPEPPGSRSGLLPLVLGPASAEAPGSSLYFMVDEVLAHLFATPARRAFGPGGLDGTAWRAALVEAESQGRPACLLGTALALHAALAWLEARGERFHLASGSRALQTGGMKASGMTLEPRELRARAAEWLGLEPAAVVGEYGMTEACSQFYESTWRDAWAGGDGCDLEAREAEEPRLLHGPPWARAVVCDPETLEPAPAGRTGVLRLVDLANRFTLSFLQTEDLAVAREGTQGLGSGPFVLAGRAAAAAARGCSLAAAEWGALRAEIGP
jgi:hypothetical protein